MQVISGSARGVPLKVAGSARPYLAKTLGAIFNSLCAQVPQARVLDLYAGSGAVGIEALSRGAQSCIFVERDKVSAQTIADNLKKCRLEEKGTVANADVAGFSCRCAEKFDLIFLDPPFKDNENWNQNQENIALMRDTAALLENGGTLVFRFERHKLEPPQWAGLTLLKDRDYGRSRVLFYGNENT